MQLSKNFGLQEMIETQTGLPNNPTEAEKEKLLYLAIYILQPIRDRWGRLDVTSGFRGFQVNQKVGGSTSSQHLLGEACDFVPCETDIDTVFRWIVEESNIRYGQAIRESVNGKEWIHISLPRLYKPNQQPLVINGKERKVYI